MMIKLQSIVICPIFSNFNNIPARYIIIFKRWQAGAVICVNLWLMNNNTITS